MPTLMHVRSNSLTLQEFQIILRAHLIFIQCHTNLNDKFPTREHVEIKEYNEVCKKRTGRHEGNKKKLKNESL